MTNKILIDAEISMSQEDFLLFKDTSEALKISIGDVIVSCARHRAMEILELDKQPISAKDPSDTGPLGGINQEDECQPTG